MSSVRFVQGEYEIDTTPEMLPDGRFVARAVVRRLLDSRVEEVHPDFEPFATEAEAASAAHIAAVAWLAHRPSGRARPQAPTSANDSRRAEGDSR